MARSPSIPWFVCGFVALVGCERTESPPEPETWARPQNEWPVTVPPPGLAGEGFEIGNTVPDVRLLDQNGDEVSLWQFYGDVVLLTVSAVWCPPCHELAVTAEEVCADLGPRGVTLLTVLMEGDGGSPLVADAAAWAEVFEARSPVLVDPEQALSPALQGSYPAVLLLDRELTVVARAPDLASETLHDLIESEL